jgi:uncharacterized protein YqeY
MAIVCYTFFMITQQIRSEIPVAMKARNSVKLDTLRGAVTAFTNELVAKGRKPTDELIDAEAIIVLKRLAKQRKDAVEQFGKGGRPELAEKESQELKIIEAYIPQGTPRADIERVARAKKEELGVTDASDIGKLTGVVMKEFAGNADGNDVKEVVATLFA